MGLDVVGRFEFGHKMESAGHSTIFASIALHRAPNTADPSAVIENPLYARAASKVLQPAAARARAASAAALKPWA